MNDLIKLYNYLKNNDNDNEIIVKQYYIWKYQDNIDEQIELLECFIESRCQKLNIPLSYNLTKALYFILRNDILGENKTFQNI